MLPNAGQRKILSRRTTILLLVVMLVAACAPHTRWNYTSGTSHVVRSGETLFTIAFRYGRDYRELARWNNLGDGSLIYPGQVIRLTPPPGMASTRSSASQRSAPKAAPARSMPAPAADPSPDWEWPTSGRVSAEFDGRPGAEAGLLIDGKAGQPVRAAAPGRVVYSGGGLIGYGQLIILKHNDTYLSAYGHNASLLVKEGDTIKKGQRIATMGEGPGQKPRLHFEIRRNGKPVDPRQFLPAR
jgi:lipoprotein NlpD